MNECPYCQSRNFVEVHGHSQCVECGVNVVPCCEGAAVGGSGEEVDPKEFVES